MAIVVKQRVGGAAAHDVRWRSPIDGGQRSRRFDDPAAAESFDRAMQATLELARAQARYDELGPEDRAWLPEVMGHLDD